MTRRTYRTAQGKTVDLGALQLKNENIRAVGNMSVNSRGDLLDSHNRPIDSRNQQVAKQYRKQVTNVQDDAVGIGNQVPHERRANETRAAGDNNFLTHKLN